MLLVKHVLHCYCCISIDSLTGWRGENLLVTAVIFVYFKAAAGPTSRFKQRGLYPNPSFGPGGVPPGRATGPRFTDIFANGPVLTQPPPRPGSRYNSSRVLPLRASLSVVPLCPGMYSPLPLMLYASPLKMGEHCGAAT